MNTNAAYQTASSFSFLLQEKESAYQLCKHAPTVMSIGIQPHGITSIRDGKSDIVAIANFESPAQHIGRISVEGNKLVRRFQLVAGATNGVTPFVRGGLPIPPGPGDAKRCFVAVIALDGKLWVSGNGERRFFELTPAAAEGRWNITREIVLPRGTGWPNEYCYLNSACLLSDGRLLTVEKTPDYRCVWRLYASAASGFTEVTCRRLYGKFRYGIAFGKFKGKEEAVTVTSYQSEEQPGIYAGPTCILDDRAVAGNGFDGFADSIAPLQNGGALLVRRGMESPNGDSLREPGALIYIPPSLFPADFEWVR